MSLEKQSCIPCQGGVVPLSTEEALVYLAELPGWTLIDQGKKIILETSFKDFQSAFTFISGIASLAEREGHHPDITFGWGYAWIMLYTHKINGLHHNDFIMAAKISALLRNH